MGTGAQVCDSWQGDRKLKPGDVESGKTVLYPSKIWYENVDLLARRNKDYDERIQRVCSRNLGCKDKQAVVLDLTFASPAETLMSTVNVMNADVSSVVLQLGNARASQTYVRSRTSI
jgi:hypothetical protein